MSTAGMALLAMAIGAASPEGEGKKIAIRAGKIIPIHGEEIRNGVILITDGKIEAVGADIKVPWDAIVIDARNKVLMPGWVEAHTDRGLDRPNEILQSVPYVSVFDSLNPLDPYFEDALRQGITSLHVSPGDRTLIGGWGGVVKPAGVTVEEMAVARDVFLKISLAASPGQNRMARVAALRKEFDVILRYLADRKEKRGKKQAPDSELEAKKEPMVRLLRGEAWALVSCPDAASVLKAIELSGRYRFKMKLVLGRDAWRAARFIAAAKLDVILDPSVEYWEADVERHEEVLRVPAVVFWKAGVKFAFRTDPSRFGTSAMWVQAATAVKHGLPREVALRAGTIHAAEILGLGRRLGTIEKGKDANLLFLTGDPLDTMTWVDSVMIEGRMVYERAKDAKLRRILDPGK